MGTYRAEQRAAGDLADALNSVVDAWEALPGGQNYRPREVQNWLSDHLAPAIKRARATLGRKAPNE